MHALSQIVSHCLRDPGFTGMFIDIALKSFLLLALAGGVCVGWRRASAATRHLVWSLAVAGLFCLPWLSFLLPAPQKPLWTVAARSSSLNQFTIALEFVPGKSAALSLTKTQAPTAGTGASSGGEAARGQRLATQVRAGWLAPAFGVWLGGVALVMLSVTAGGLRLRAIRRRAGAPLSTDWNTLSNELRGKLKLTRPVVLLQSEDNLMPVTWGWWRPVILLPAKAEAWPEERRRVVLLHELAHVKRWDCLTQVLTSLVCAGYWFNPLVWLAAHRMRIERERACDDLVLRGGCKPSEYAGHLVEIARSFCRVPWVPAIAMARSSQLQKRIGALVDASRARNRPAAWVLVLYCVGGLGLTVGIAAQKPAAATIPVVAAAAAQKPWFDARLRALFTAKAKQAHELADRAQQPVPPELWPYFEAGIKGDWETMTNLWNGIRPKAHRDEEAKPGSAPETPPLCVHPVWPAVLETYAAWEEFTNWKEKDLLAFGNGIIKSIPPGSIYFGGTDPGRWIVTAMSESHVEGKPFFTLTQNALADHNYLAYLRSMYGARIYIPTEQDVTNAFDRYTADAERRLKENKLIPGESVTMANGKVKVEGQLAVMAINGLLTRVVFDKNPEREFYLEESFPLDWMYPYLSPHELILKINRRPLAELSDELVRRDHEYWTRQVQPMIGGWLNYDTPLREVVAFIEKVYVNHDLAGFRGDRQFVQDDAAQKAFAKLRSASGGLYNWRLAQAKSPAERERMSKEAEFAFRQAIAICPSSPEAVLRYMNLLVSAKRYDDALLVMTTCQKLAEQSQKEMFDSLVRYLKESKARQETRGMK